MSVQVEHDYYGVPLWLMKDYLAQLGGRETGEDVVEGDGWRAEVRKAERRHIGSLSIGGATVVFTGEQQATLDALFEKLHWKTLRGGG
jgi:hypothetical protein